MGSRQTSAKKVTDKGGRPPVKIRWTLHHAESEFGPERRTIAKKLRAASIEPGRDGKYSTIDIHRALAGGSSTDEKNRAQTELFRIQAETLRKVRPRIEDVRELWDAQIQSFAGTLKANSGKILTPELINDLFAEMRNAEVPIE